MALLADIRVLYHMAISPIRGRNHAERLESFYKGQARDYDAFRERLLRGRAELFRNVSLAEEGTWIDMGGGTGVSAEYMAHRLHPRNKAYIVDLCPSLLAVAQERIAAHDWSHIIPVAADATAFSPPEQKINLISFCYSLTMIPDWYQAINHAHSLLETGGSIAVVDFYVSRKYPPKDHVRHTCFTRSFWPLWFSMDNVFPSPDHIPYLKSTFETVYFSERCAAVPYLPGLRVPYYLFIGKKRGADKVLGSK